MVWGATGRSNRKRHWRARRAWTAWRCPTIGRQKVVVGRFEAKNGLGVVYLFQRRQIRQRIVQWTVSLRFSKKNNIIIILDQNARQSLEESFRGLISLPGSWLGADKVVGRHDFTPIFGPFWLLTQLHRMDRIVVHLVYRFSQPTLFRICWVCTLGGIATATRRVRICIKFWLLFHRDWHRFTDGLVELATMLFFFRISTAK